MSEASGGREETPHVRDQGWPGEATLCPRPGAVTLRSHPEPEARGGSWSSHPCPRPWPAARRSNPRAVAEQAQEGLEELSHVESQERRR